jgi:hypothetical protein
VAVSEVVVVSDALVFIVMSFSVTAACALWHFHDQAIDLSIN